MCRMGRTDHGSPDRERIQARADEPSSGECHKRVHARLPTRYASALIEMEPGYARDGRNITVDRLGSVRAGADRDAFRPDLGRHQALGPGAEPDEHELARTQLGQSVPAQDLHVHEDVRRALAAGEETEAA